MRLDELDADLGDGIRLRVLEPADAPELFALTDANREHLAPWMPWVEHTTREAHTRAYLEAVSEALDAGTGAAFAILVDGRIAGTVGFNRIDAANRSAEIGYWLAEPYRGRGVMTRAVAELVDMAFDRLHLHRVELLIATENAPSRAIAERLGFRHEGVRRDGERHTGRYLDLDVFALVEGDRRAASR